MNSDNMLKVYSPFDRKLIREIPMAGKEEVETALKIAYNLFLDRTKWIGAHKKISILKRVQDLMEADIENLTNTAAHEGGKPYQDSKVEVIRAINGVKLASDEIARLTGTQIPMGLTEASATRVAFTTREPIGVVASISAFNHPLNLIVHQTVTAFAAGCPVIVKPASTTPMSCLLFADILYKAGVPKDWVQVLITENEAAELLVTDKRVNYLSFIGSAKVGWLLKSKLSPGTRCALEHGGAAPVIVEADADFKEMIPALVKGGFYHAGQVCVSVQRIFAHETIAQAVADAVALLAGKLRVGDPLDKNTEVGPLISTKEVSRVATWVEEAVMAGAKILCGGNKISATCYAPTVLWNPPRDAKVSNEEIFGPVVCVYPYNDRDDAIREANRLDYHFQAAVFTQNIDVALDTVQKLNATAVMVNDHTAFRVDWMPFGGRDASGEGLGGIPYTMHEMTREKLMVIKSRMIL
ncbi:MAG: aldehyde dehydrogenase family protein [Chryseolinea sp.]